MGLSTWVVWVGEIGALHSQWENLVSQILVVVGSKSQNLLSELGLGNVHHRGFFQFLDRRRTVFASFDELGMKSKGVISDFFLGSEEKTTRRAKVGSVDGPHFCFAELDLDNRDGNFLADFCSPVLPQDDI